MIDYSPLLTTTGGDSGWLKIKLIDLGTKKAAAHSYLYCNRNSGLVQKESPVNKMKQILSEVVALP